MIKQKQTDWYNQQAEAIEKTMWQVKNTHAELFKKQSPFYYDIFMGRVYAKLLRIFYQQLDDLFLTRTNKTNK